MSAPLPTTFRRLAASNLAAQTAEQISLAAMPIVAVVSLDARAEEIGLLGIAQTLPFLLFSIPAGMLADRLSRRRLMMVAEALRALAFAGLLLGSLTGMLSLPWLAVLGFVGALGTVGFSVAAPSMVLALVPRDRLAAANSRLEVARSMAFAAGPALAGALVSWAGGSTAFTLAAMLSVASMALLTGLPAAIPSRDRPRGRVLVELREGFATVWTSDLLRPILFTALVWNVSWFVFQSAYVPYAMRVLGLSAQAVGWTLAAYGVGMVAGALGTPYLLRVLRFGHALLLGPLMSVLAMLAMVATLQWPSFWMAALSYLLFGAGPIVWTITSTTLRQTVTPEAVLGRVTAVFLMVNMGARPLGAALGATVGGGWGEAACLVVAFVGFSTQALIIWVSAVRGLKSLPSSVDGSAHRL